MRWINTDFLNSLISKPELKGLFYTAAIKIRSICVIRVPLVFVQKKKSCRETRQDLNYFICYIKTLSSLLFSAPVAG